MRRNQHERNEDSPPPAPSPARGEGKFRDWPVERTALLAAGQTDGVLSDINFGEVLPFVAKPLVKDYLPDYLGPILGCQFAGLPPTDPLGPDMNPTAFAVCRPYLGPYAA